MKSLFLFLGVLLLTACGPGLTDDNLVGTWKTTDFKDRTNNISEEIIKEGKEVALSSVYTFKEDHTYKIDYKDQGYSDEGTWKIDAEAQTIVFKSEDGYENTQLVDEFNGYNMVWKHDSGEYGYVLTIMEKE